SFWPSLRSMPSCSASCLVRFIGSTKRRAGLVREAAASNITGGGLNRAGFVGEFAIFRADPKRVVGLAACANAARAGDGARSWLLLHHQLETAWTVRADSLQFPQQAVSLRLGGARAATCDRIDSLDSKAGAIHR